MLSQENIDQLFMQLLSRTATDPNHGRYPNYQEDSQGSLWSYTDTLNAGQALDIIEHLGETLGLTFSLPQQGHFTLIGVEDQQLQAIYASSFNQNYYLLQTDGSRYYQWLLRKFHTKEATTSQQEAYLTLQQIYGSLPLSQLVA